jgi:hypothetical protein
LVRKPEGKRPLGRPRLRREDNIKIDLREIGWGSMDRVDLGQDRGFREHGNERSVFLKCWEILVWLGD